MRFPVDSAVRRTAPGWLPLFIGSILLQFGPALAADYPNRVVRIIIPFTAGGAVDIVGRSFSQKLAEAIQQPVVIENRPGADAVIGVNYAVGANPDGYTMLLTTGSMIAAPLLLANVPYDPLRDVTPVTQLVYSQGTILTARPDFPAKTLAELVTLAKKTPGKFNYGHTGAGTPPYVAAELFKNFAGIDIFGVPYKGTNNVLTDIIGRQIDMTFSGIPSVLQFARAGQVRAIASTGVRRTAALPDVPTFKESGYEKMDIRGYYGLWVPAATPRDRINRIYGLSVKVLANPELRKVFESGALEVIGSSPQEFAAFIKNDFEVQKGIVTLLGLQPSR
jgi:tripartite-type tricarboxylate transporter receptor subunit TctC